MRYCLDSNTLIEAKNIHYAMDFCPAFWDMVDAHSADTLFSIAQVYDELVKGEDELAQWVKGRKESGLFVPADDEATQQEFAKIANFVAENYAQEQAEYFLSGADPWLIAKCKTAEATLVTKEVPAPGAKRVKIPNICQEFGVSFVPTHEMIRALNARYVLEQL